MSDPTAATSYQPRHTSGRRARAFTLDDSPQELLAEVVRLTGCLQRANSGFADYEARYLMADAALEEVLEMAERPVARVDVPAEVRAIVVRYRQATSTGS